MLHLLTASSNPGGKKKMKIPCALSSFLFLISALLSTAMAQIAFPIDLATNKITFQKVIVLDSTYSKEILYANARNWIEKSMQNSKQSPNTGIDFEYVQMNDIASGKIAGKGSVPITVNITNKTQDAGYIHFRISIFVEDGQYKYVFSNFYHTGFGEYFTSNGFLENEDSKNSNMSYGCWADLKNNTLKKMISLIKDFNASMKTRENSLR
jgi:hypothetical protein